MDQYLDEQQLSRCARSLKRGATNGTDTNGQDDMSDYGEYDDDLNYMMMTEKRPANTDVLLDGDSAFSASIVSDLRTLAEDARIIAKQQIMLLLETGKMPSTPGSNYL
uniref:BESS domain-containing protein n=1 Tax=Caenorhabditis japonica TaxID=281687 RepID=A0A8R1ISE6_CAEJA